MDRSSAGIWMLLASVAIPALVGVFEAWRRGRGAIGYVVNLAVSVLAGLGLMVLFVALFFDRARGSELASFVMIMSGLVGGPLIELWVLNRVRG
jgi:hypothetical protein